MTIFTETISPSPSERVGGDHDKQCPGTALTRNRPVAGEGDLSDMGFAEMAVSLEIENARAQRIWEDLKQDIADAAAMHLYIICLERCDRLAQAMKRRCA